MRHYLHRFFLLAVFTVLLVTQASALEYSYDLRRTICSAGPPARTPPMRRKIPMWTGAKTLH